MKLSFKKYLGLLSVGIIGVIAYFYYFAPMQEAQKKQGLEQ